jgi:hypothetical protein
MEAPMIDDKWRDTYDAWKLRSPDDDNRFWSDEPEEDDGRDAWRNAMIAKIKTERDEVAPRQFGWVATVGDYDLDDPIGRGATEAEAIQDLLERLEK